MKKQLNVLLFLITLWAGSINSFGQTSIIAGWGPDNDFGQLNFPAGLTNAVGIAAGISNSMVLTADGSVLVLGDNTYGQTNVPAGLTNVLAVAAGSSHCLALNYDGTVVAWGSDNFGQTNVPVGLSNVVAIAGGNAHSLALKNDGTVVVWGRNISTNLPGGLTNVVAITAGINYSLALLGNGTVVGWGKNNGVTNIPSGLTNVVGIAGGGNFALALTGDGLVTEWGSDVPYGNTVPPGLSNVVAVAAGDYASLALKSDGTVTEWSSSSSPPVNLTNVVAIASGNNDGLALCALLPVIQVEPTNEVAQQGGSATLAVTVTGIGLSYQWYYNGAAVPGANTNILMLTGLNPWNSGMYTVVVSNIFGYASSPYANLTVIAPSDIIGWGPDNDFGQLNFPAGLTNAVGIAAGASNSMVLTADGSVLVLGDNTYGQTNVPAGLTNVLAIAAGASHCLALNYDETVVAWGLDNFGQANVPSGLTNVVAIAGGNAHSLALKNDGTVVVWGHNIATNLPGGLTNVVAITAGINYSLALLGNGTVVGWGKNNMVTNIPSGLTNVVGIAGGGNYALALMSDGMVMEWGSDSPFISTVPPGLSNVVAVAAGDYASLALKSDGTVAEWGSSSSPANLTNVVAIASGNNDGLALYSILPTIGVEPTSQSIAQGSNVTFSVVAGGTALYYQWYYDGSAIANANNSSFTLTNVASWNAGTYFVLVSNCLGSIISSGASLTVIIPPAIQAEPTNEVAQQGGSATLAVTAIGTGLSYQWYYNGAAVPGANTNILMLTGLNPWNSGMYTVVVSNTLGSVSSSYASLRVIAASRITGWGPDNDFGQLNFPAGLTNAVGIAAGASNSVVLTADGSLFVLGDNTYGQTNVPAGLTNVLAIAAGGSHCLALNYDGTVVAWGLDNFGQANVPSGLTNVVAIAGGNAHSLALKNDGTVVVWGHNIATNLPGGLTNVVAITAGINYSLALLGNGTVVGWGKNNMVTNIPSGLTNVVGIAGGGNYALALMSDGMVMEWGSDSPFISTVPPGLSNVVAVAAGDYASLALKSDGTVAEWGSSSSPANLTNVVAIASGNNDGIALGDFYPLITLQPQAQIVMLGSNADFSIAATGTDPLSYQWYKNGILLSGETNNTLAINNAQTNDAGSYVVNVSNVVGVASSMAASLVIELLPLFDPTTLAYYLSTNMVSHTNGFSNPDSAMVELSNWTYTTYSGTNMAYLTNAVWSTNFWFSGVKGLSATPIGFSNGVGGEGLVTMVSPRHYLFATHMHPEGYLTAFLDTNNIIYWRTTLERVDVSDDTSVGILNADLPSSVGYLAILPSNYTNYLPAPGSAFFQGLGMNQGMMIFSQPMTFGNPIVITNNFLQWNSGTNCPFSVTTNWNVGIVGGDSSDPEVLVISNQFILASHNFSANLGPNYALQIDAINQTMHYLSTNNSAGSDYQLTQYSLTNWPVLYQF